MEAKEIWAGLDRVQDLPTLPPVAMEVNALLQDQDTSIRKLSQTIERDQAITARILRLVNSAFFGLGSKVGNIPHALVLLGFNTVRNAVLSLAVIDAFRMKQGNGFDVKEFWRHSIAVAVVSKHLAEKTRFYPPDDVFTAGLLHDVGKFILSLCFHDVFQRVWARARNDHLPFLEAEREELPVHHGQIGAYLARKWKLPLSLVEAIQYHHTVKDDAHEPNLLRIVNAADAMVNSLDNGAGKVLARKVADPSMPKALGSLLETAAEWFQPVSEEIASATAFFMKE
ncbi:MAG: HDOD domain-containing protein [Thermodesulfobacteriota bacterium]